MFFVSGYRSSLRRLLTELRNGYCIGTVLCHETCALSCTNMDVDDIWQRHGRWESRWRIYLILFIILGLEIYRTVNMIQWVYNFDVLPIRSEYQGSSKGCMQKGSKWNPSSQNLKFWWKRLTWYDPFSKKALITIIYMSFKYTVKAFNDFKNKQQKCVK